MKPDHYLKIGLVVCLLSLGSQATAESFKCGNRFVSIGDSKAEVLLRCGEPFFAEVISGDDQVKVEQWAYKKKGYRSFIRILTFSGGVLRDIKVADRE